MLQDKLTRDQLVKSARQQNPEFYKDWGDDQIFRGLMRDQPELRESIDFESTGERLYKQFGSKEAANFGERLGFQFDTQIQGMKAGLIGLAPWNSAEAGEKARGFANQIYRDRIANNQKLQALTAWKEDEVGWDNPQTALRSLSEALPSLAISFSSLALAPFTKGGSLVAGAAALAPIAIMEGTNMYNEMMSTMVDELGLTPEEARKHAYAGTALYTPIATLLERLGVKAWGSTVGIGDAAFNATFRKSIAQKIVDWGLTEKMIAKSVGRGIVGFSSVVQNVITEGSTEGLQAFTQNAITKGYELGLGDNDLEVREVIQKTFKETWNEPAVWEEGFAGATTGVLGLGSGIMPGAISVEKQQQILDDIAKKENEPTDLPEETSVEDVPVQPKKVTKAILQEEARTLKIKGFSKMNKTQLSEAIDKAKKKSSKNKLTADYLDAIVDTDEMESVINETSAINIEKDSAKNKESKEEANRIIKANSIQNAGKKILSLIVGNKNADDIIDSIVNAKNSEDLLNLARQELNVAISNSDKKSIRGLEIPNKRESIIDALSTFAKRGAAEDVISDTGDINDGVSDTIFTYDPTQIEDIIPEDSIPEPLAPEIEQEQSIKDSNVEKDATAPSLIKKGKAGVMSSEAINAEEKGIPKGMKKNVDSLKKSSNLFEVLEVKGKSLVLQEIDPTQNPVGKPIEVPKTISGMPILSLIDTKSQEVDSEAALEASIEISSPGVKLAKPKKANEKATPVIVKKTEDTKLEVGMPVKINKDLIGKTNIKDKSLKSRMNKLSKGNWEVIKVNAKSYKLKSLDTNEVVTVPSSIFVKGKGIPKNTKLPSIVAAKDSDVVKPKPRTVKEVFGDDTGGDRKQLELNDRIKRQKKYKKSLVKNLKDELNKRKLSLKGNKEALILRLMKNDEKILREKNKKRDETKAKNKSKVVLGVKTSEPKIKYDKKKKQFYVTVNGKRVNANVDEEIEAKKLATRRKKLGKNPPKSSLDKYENDREAFILKVIERAVGLSKSEVVIETVNEEKTFTKDEKQQAADRDLGFKFQDDQSSEEVLISDDKVLAEKILSKLKKHFPFVDVKTFEGTLNIFGKQRIGFAMERLVAWSKTDGRMDTMPHEYAHIYINLFRNHPLVKQGIKKFNSEEDLVRYIGLYYVGRMRNTKLIPRIKIWLKQFANRLKKYFGGEVSNIEQFIAEEFYQGRFLGSEAVVGDQFIDFMDKEIEDSGQETSDDFTTFKSDIHLTKFYEKTLGIYFDKVEHYPMLLEIAKNAKNRDNYITDLYAFALKVATNRAAVIEGKSELELLKNITLKDKDGNYILEKENPSDWTSLNMDWMRALEKISRFDPENANFQGADTRIYQQLVIDGTTPNSKGDGITIAGIKSRIDGKKASQNNVMNFFEAQQVSEKTGTRLLILPIKQIAKTNINRQKVPEKRFWTSANFSFDKGQIFSLQRKYATQYYMQIKERMDAKGFGASKDLSLKSLVTDPWLASFLGSKLGDNAAGISTFVQVEDRPLNITPASFKAFFENELKVNKNINQSHFDEIIKDAEKLENSKNPLMNLTIEEYIDEQISKKAKRSEIISNISKYVEEVVLKKYKMSQSISRYKTWQQIRVPNYLLFEKSVADSMTRMSIDLAEGVNPRGLGDSKLMVIPKKAKVEVKDENGKWVDAGIYDDFDGATFSSGAWFDAISKILGSDRLTQLKTFIRQRDVNKNNSNKVDYIGMKHMQFTPFKNMRFYKPGKDGEMIAEVKGAGRNTFFESANGEKFDLIASPNEAKMMYGKYNDSDYAIHTISEKSVKVHDIQRTSKTNASHPIALGEMILAATIGKNTAEAKEVVKQIKERYKEVINHYTNEISDLYKDPKNLIKFLKKEKEEGQLPMELDDYVALIKEDGKGLWSNQIRAHLTPILNSRLIRDGLYKARSWGKTSSKVYLKPGVHLDIKKDNVIISSDNKAAYINVERAFKKVNNIKGSMSNYWKNERNIKPNEQHKRIVILNDFLLNNEVNVLIHRNPIQKTTGVVLRRIQRLQEGFHGENMFLSWADVKSVLDGDWDGDTAQFEFINDKYASALKNWQSSDAFASLNKIVSVGGFSSRVDKTEENEQNTSLSSFDDIATTVAENAQLDGSTGSFVNAKTIQAQLYYKNFKLFHEDLQGDKAFLRVINPNDSVIMDYAPLIPANLDNIVDEKSKKTELDLIIENGDRLVDIDGNPVNKDFEGNIYLETTKSHEISTLFQMAVDSSKYPIFGKILAKSKLSSFEFMLSKIFEVADKDGSLSSRIPLFTKNELSMRKGNNPVSKIMGMLSIVYRAQNMSKLRGGVDLNSNSQKSASYGKNITQAMELNDRFFDKNGKKRSNNDYAQKFIESMTTNKGEDIFDSSKHGGFYGKGVTMKNVSTPQEELITGLATIGVNDFYKITNNLYAKRQAHVEAVKQLVKQASDLPMWGNFVNGKNIKDYNQMKDFLYADNEFNGEDIGSFVEQWGVLQEKNSKTENIQSDLSSDYVSFTERNIEQWRKMSEPAQIWATLTMLKGFSDDVHILKFPPLALMNKKIIAMYLPIYEEKLRGQPSDLGEANAQKNRETVSMEFNKIWTKTNNTYSKIDKKLGVCR